MSTLDSAGIVEFNGVMLFPQQAPIPASPGTLSIQNILGTLKQVNDQGVASSIGGGGGGLTPIANNTVLGNTSGGAATPTAQNAAALISAGLVQNPALVDISGGVISGCDVSGCTAATDATAGVMSAADKTKLDSYLTTQEATVTVAGAAVASVSLASVFGGMDGNRDGRYTIFFSIATPAGTGGVSYSCKPNNVATNQFMVTIVGSASIAVAQATTLVLMNAGTANAGFLTGRIEIEAKTGQGPRYYRSRCFRMDATAGSTASASYDIEAAWNESATNLTDFVIAASSGNSIGIGSWFKVRRYSGVQ